MFALAENDRLMTSGDIARLLQLSTQRVQQLIQAGVLVPVATTAGGMRLFSELEVTEIHQQRKQRKGSRSNTTKDRRLNVAK